MTQLTVKALSEEIGTPVDRLIEQLADAGMKKSGSDQVTDSEKQTLLTHLKKEHGDTSGEAEPTRLTLQRKTRSTLSVAAGGGKSKDVQVEVRKKRTYVKRKRKHVKKLKSLRNVKLQRKHSAKLMRKQNVKRMQNVKLKKKLNAPKLKRLKKT